MNEPQEQAQKDAPEHRLMFPAALIVYALLLGAALLWFYFRGRLSEVPQRALGDHGPWVSLFAGTAVGLLCSGVFLLARRYLRSFRGLESRLAEIVGPLNEVEILGIALVSAIGEEFFFRGAMQDAWGIWWAAAVFGLLHSGPGLLLWGMVAFCLGLLFSCMVDYGLGLLSVTVAHALINNISLRRMVPS
ncbi:MAG: CPBP family intramembrane glutamic endopeptidase [Planctomycetota bacterium]